MNRVIVIQPYRNTKCTNTECINFDNEIQPDLRWAQGCGKEIEGMSFRDFCPECGDGAGWTVIQVIDNAKDEIIDRLDDISKQLREGKRASEKRVQDAHRDGNQIIYGGYSRHDA